MFNMFDAKLYLLNYIHYVQLGVIFSRIMLNILLYVLCITCRIYLGDILLYLLCAICIICILLHVLYALSTVSAPSYYVGKLILTLHSFTTVILRP